MIRKIIIIISVLILILFLFILGLYFIPPDQEQIEYEYVTQRSDYQFDSKIGWYKSTEGLNYQVTWGAKKGLRLNLFDSLRSNLKSIPLSPIDDNRFDTDGISESAEVVFRGSEYDQNYLLSVNTSKTKFTAEQSDSIFYWQKEVEYYNDNIKFVGLLLVPHNIKTTNAIVFIHGSGFSDRDMFWYMYQADYLAKKGLIVLLPDKRGSGKSFGEWHTASFDDFANDTESGIKYLNEQYSDKINKIGVIGLSQGGWISHLVASKTELVEFVVDVVGATTTPNEQLEHEIKNDIISSGAPEFIAAPLSFIFAKRTRAKRKIWWDLNGNFDPLPLMRKAEIPMLKIFGRNDEFENVPVEKSIKRINGLLNEKPQLPLTIKVFEDLGHALIDSKTGWISNEYLEHVARWIKE